MKKIYYFYDPVLKSNEVSGCKYYIVDIYCTNGKKSIFTKSILNDSPIAALKFARRLVNKLNRPRPIFGYNGRICQWLWFITR
jgi:hypothetical protein